MGYNMQFRGLVRWGLNNVRRVKTSPLKFTTYNYGTLSQDHLSFRQKCREFVETEVRPAASELDKNSQFPARQIKKMGDMGLLAINVPTKCGGSGLDMLSLSLAIEEISRGCAGTGAIASIHNSLYVNLISKRGTDDQKERFLRPFVCGELGCFALSETEAGSDVVNISTEARKEGDRYILNGKKTWVTSGHQGKAAVVFATVDKSLRHKGITAFIVPIPSRGLTLGRNEDKMGIRASSTCDLILDNVEVPDTNVLGKVGDGFKIAMTQLDEGRIGIASQALGIAQASLEAALAYASQRCSAGRPINSLQAVQLRLANMALRLEAARLLVRRAAVSCDQDMPNTKYTSMAKLAASEAATYVAHNAIQVLGGMGYVKDMPVERHYRDARITEIYGGVSDIQRLVIADAVIREYER